MKTERLSEKARVVEIPIGTETETGTEIWGGYD